MPRLTRLFASTIVALAPSVLGSTSVLAQAQAGRLLVTVVDATGAVLPGATVTVNGLEAATAKVPPPVQSSGQGVATFAGLALGRYRIQAEFPGFQTATLADVGVRTGDNKQVIVLAIQKLEDSVTVGQDRQTAAADPRGASFGSALTREQIDALSDDSAELQRQLQDIAGPGGVLRVDSFEGAQLPPKSQIKSIHVTRDGFAAENHSAGGVFIDIITQPGLGPLRGGLNYRLRDGAFSSRSPFTATKGAEQTQNYNLNLGGSLQKDKSSFFLGVGGLVSYDTPNLNAALPTGTRSETLNLRTPRDNMFLNAGLDYALTRDQTLRFNYFQSSFTNKNLGVGAYDLPERAFASQQQSYQFRVQEAGPVGRRFFTNTRFFINKSDTQNTSALEAPTIRVNDAFNSGGQQVAGGRRFTLFNLASDLDYIRGIHSMRAGVLFDGASFHADDSSNYLGTYTFQSLAAYQAGQPTSYTRRIGDPNIQYFNLRTSLYVQDDIRIRRNLTLSPGLRYEAEMRPGDYNNVGPRFGITWSPFKSGRTTLRGSAGIFYDWLNGNTYEQTLRVDGFHQQELNIFGPPYPDPGNVGIVPPVNRYLLVDGLQLARNSRVSAGIDRTISPRVRVSLLYAYVRGSNLLRGLNLNAPVNGVRPDPTFGNIVEVVGDASSRQHTLTTTANLGPPPGPPANNASAPRWDWKRTSVQLSYTLGSLRNNTDGDLSTPPTGNLADEWGPAGNDIRHRTFVSLNSQALKNFNVNLNLNASTGSAYTIRTGFDDNGDLVFNDRPQGISRNTLRQPAQWTLNANFAYTFFFGRQPAVPGPNGIFINIPAPGAAPIVGTAPPPTSRYRLQFFVNAQNLTNHANFIGYNGSMTSPFFEKATNVAGMRKIDVGINLGF